VVMDACKDIDVEVVYITGLGIKGHIENYGRVAIVEPYYEGTTARLWNIDGDVYSIGVPRGFLTEYGTTEEHDNALALSTEHIRVQLKLFFND